MTSRSAYCHFEYVIIGSSVNAACFISLYAICGESVASGQCTVIPERLRIVRGRKGIVHDQRDGQRLGKTGQAPQVIDAHGGVFDALHVHSPNICCGLAFRYICVLHHHPKCPFRSTLQSASVCDCNYYAMHLQLPWPILISSVLHSQIDANKAFELAVAPVGHCIAPNIPCSSSSSATASRLVVSTKWTVMPYCLCSFIMNECVQPYTANQEVDHCAVQRMQVQTSLLAFT